MNNFEITVSTYLKVENRMKIKKTKNKGRCEEGGVEGRRKEERKNKGRKK